MPGMNQTGPMGQGPRTGRGLGRCNPGGRNVQKTDDETTEQGNQTPEQNFNRRNDFGPWGRGGGGRRMGRRNRFRGGY